MTRSAYRLSFITLAFAALAFALPAYAYQNDYRHDRSHDDEDVRIPSCELSISPNTVRYGGEVTLSWESSDAQWAQISDIGAVNPNGSLRIRVVESKTYHMTVYNDDRSAECDAFVNIPGDHYSGGYPHYTYPNYPQYIYPASYPTYTYSVPTYVSLTQIPYTGFDFGPVGNAIYWATLIVLAVGAAYILVYQQGFRALASMELVAETVQAGKMQYRALQRFAGGGFVRQSVAAKAPVVPAATAPAATQTLTVTKLGNDTMAMVEGDQPRIVITRS